MKPHGIEQIRDNPAHNDFANTRNLKDVILRARPAVAFVILFYRIRRML
jgi:hypothetical protein